MWRFIIGIIVGIGAIALLLVGPFLLVASASALPVSRILMIVGLVLCVPGILLIYSAASR